MDILRKIITDSKENKKVLITDTGYTYQNFFYEKEKFLKYLKKISSRNNETIAICSKYNTSFLCLIFAAYENGNVVTLINPTSSYDEKLHIIKDSSSSLIFFEKDENLILTQKNYLKFKNFKIFKKKTFNKFVKKKDNFIIYTSGTTSKPKGVILTNKAISSNVMGISEDLKIKLADSSIIFSPPSYAMALSQILTCMLNKICFVFEPTGLRFPNTLIEKIKKNNISLVNLSISAFRILLPYLNKKKTTFKHVRILMSGGMQMTDEIVFQYRKFFPKAKIINFYGCTENSPRISHFHIEKFQKGKYDIWPVGKPLKGIKIKVLKKNKQKGKILISGSSLMRGYLKKAELTRKKIRNGWFDTGDLGYFDKNNFLILSGREDDSFRVGHEKLYPEEVEPVIKRKLKISELVVAKKRNKILDWEPILVLKKKDYKRFTPEKIRILLSDNLSNYKIPKKIFGLEKFPKTRYGKINRKEINGQIN